MKIVVHAGFHKTGTTSLQRTLHANRAHLSSHLNILLPPDVADMARAARRISITQNERGQRNFEKSVEHMLRKQNHDDQRITFLSCEDLSGVIPGRRGVWSYRSSPLIAKLLYSTFHKRLEGEFSLSMIYTTRNAHDWMRSVYWQNLRSNRITEDFEEYSRKLQPASNLTEVVNQVKKTVGTHCEVMNFDIDQCHGKYGALGNILDHLNVAYTDIEEISKQNVQPESGISDLLTLNKSNISDDQLRLEKTKYLKRVSLKGKR